MNPPVHAWAALRVYQIERKRRGVGDRAFLERVFQKLLLNFTWWVNRKDAEGMNVFQGGFLGLDNIGVFDRSAPLPTGGHLEQSDGTSWMAMYSLNMLAIATELARENSAYEDVASKFWEHFLNIAHAMSGGSLHGGKGHDLWDDEDGFFYDVLHMPDDSRTPLRVRSLVGLIPLLAVQTLEQETLDTLRGFRNRMVWFVENRRDLTGNVACMRTAGNEERRLLAILDRDRLRRVLQRHARRERVPVAVRHPLDLADPPRSPVRARRERDDLLACRTSRRNHPPDSSAATRTGAGRSGSRSTTC